MATALNQVGENVKDKTTLIDATSELIAGLHTQVGEALESSGAPAATVEAVGKVFAAAQREKAKLAGDLVFGTPAALLPLNAPGHPDAYKAPVVMPPRGPAPLTPQQIADNEEAKKIHAAAAAAPK